MIAIVAFALLSAASLASASQSSLLVEGLAVGLTAEIGNVTECTKGVQLSMTFYHDAMMSMKKGQDAHVAAGVQAAVAVFGKSMRELSHAFTVCGLFSVAERVELAGQALSEGNFLTVSPVGAVSFGEVQLTDDFAFAAKYWLAGDAFQSGVFAGRVVATLIESTGPKALQARAYF